MTQCPAIGIFFVHKGEPIVFGHPFGLIEKAKAVFHKRKYLDICLHILLIGDRNLLYGRATALHQKGNLHLYTGKRIIMIGNKIGIRSGNDRRLVHVGKVVYPFFAHFKSQTHIAATVGDKIYATGRVIKIKRISLIQHKLRTLHGRSISSKKGISGTNPEMR